METIRKTIIRAYGTLRIGAGFITRKAAVFSLVGLAAILSALTLGVSARELAAAISQDQEQGQGQGQIAYVLKVEGEVVGAADDQAVIFEVLDSILEEYSSETTTSVRFVSDISITPQVVSEDIVKDHDALLDLLTPENEDAVLVVESTQSEMRIEEIPFETVYVEDDTLYEDEREVVTEGRAGVMLIPETIVRLGGVEQSREAEHEFMLLPVTEEIAIGTIPREAERAYIWPADGPVASGFGPRNISIGSRNHRGIDISGSLGQAIYAADYGVVVFSGWNSGGFGYMVRILHDNGDETLYAHCSQLLVSYGDQVYQGQTIALMGSTGTSTGVHLHFEIIIDGIQVNPLLFLDER